MAGSTIVANACGVAGVGGTAGAAVTCAASGRSLLSAEDDAPWGEGG